MDQDSIQKELVQNKMRSGYRSAVTGSLANTSTSDFRLIFFWVLINLKIQVHIEI